MKRKTSPYHVYRGWIRAYTGMFAIVCSVMLLILYFFGKSLVTGFDGYHQHFTLTEYVGDMLRGLLSGNSFRMVDFSLGQGLDTIGTLTYYGLFDPINLVLVFFSGRGLETAYALTIILRLYFIGLFFGLYLRKIHIENRWVVSVAALCYALCGQNLKCTIMHPYFSDGGMYLALMLLGIECVLTARKWTVMSVSTAFMLIANYYFAYQTTLLAMLYVLVRLIAGLRETGIKRTLQRAGRLIGAYLLGMALSSVIFLPAALAFLGNGRVGVVAGYSDSLWYYKPAHYAHMIALFCAPYKDGSHWLMENFSPLALICVLALFVPSRKSEGRALRDTTSSQLRAAFLICLLFGSIPLIARVFNGMSYVANRWCYGYAFVVCLVLARGLPRLLDRNNTNLIAVLRLTMAYVVIILLAIRHYNAFLMLVTSLCILAFSLFLWIYWKKPVIDAEQGVKALSILTFLCLIFYATTVFMPVGKGFTEDMHDSGVYDRIMAEPYAKAGEIDDDSFFRVDTGFWDDCHQSMQNYHGTSYFWSVIPEACFTHYRNLYMGTLANASQIYGLGHGAILNALASVKYSVRGEDDSYATPYGYEKIDDGGVSIYQNRYALPLMYAYSDTLSTQYYGQLSPIDKQAALLAYAVADDAEGNKFVSPIYDMDWTIAEANNVIVTDHTLTASEGGYLRLRFDGEPDSETHIVIALQNPHPRISIVYLKLAIQSEAGGSQVIMIDPTSDSGIDQYGLSACVGYSEAGMNECVIRFEDAAEIHYESINIYSLPMSYYRDHIETLIANAAEDIVVSNNRITGRIEMNAAGVMQISVPYGKGWTATVDGEKAGIFLCGGMYMGIALDEGAHEIALAYETPGLKTGAILSACALTLAMGLWLYQKRRAISMN